ncbi:CDP-diacylglycerol--glycerol-3-phosphate 3-phosphatidyltransferase [uncultured Tolumonas sp.]|uniref:CDP-diacylglycerol--glycerol-3-phosphate 3-phosphatidyltransferase n=1 Tax=uncultured Tolumonas sp. TaxID=263765 RepID=UPI00292CD7B1|nr:CDP-diacylglycerol--glycerol-3-phosphate 3-phosphatidyltransferase [uncultured Tolumonas sp.]
MYLTLPNILTLLRILAVPVFAIAVWYGYGVEACVIFAAAGLTDMLDGYVARRFNQKSTVGAVLDPAADKLLMTTAFVLLAMPIGHLAIRIPAWVAILAISRDVIISLVALMSAGHFDPSRFRPTPLGKLTTAVQLVAISVTLLFNALGPEPWYRFLVPWIFYLVAAFVLASGTHYFFRATVQRTEPQ